MACGGVLALLLSGVSVVRAQVAILPPIDTDRPDITDGAATIPRGHVQVEGGYSRIRSRYDVTSYTVPEMLIRVGVSGGVELRVSESYQSMPSGWDDIQLGTKFRLVPQRGNRPAFSAEAFVTLPTGSEAITAHRAQPGVALLAQWDGQGDWSVGAEVQGERGAEAGISWIPSLSIQYHHGNRIQLYGEFFTVQSTAAGPAGESYFNTGLLLRITDNLQADVHAAAGLNHAAAKYLFGFGLAVRR